MWNNEKNYQWGVSRELAQWNGCWTKKRLRTFTLMKRIAIGRSIRVSFATILLVQNRACTNKISSTIRYENQVEEKRNLAGSNYFGRLCVSFVSDLRSSAVFFRENFPFDETNTFSGPKSFISRRFRAPCRAVVVLRLARWISRLPGERTFFGVAKIRLLRENQISRPVQVQFDILPRPPAVQTTIKYTDVYERFTRCDRWGRRFSLRFAVFARSSQNYTR